MSKSQWFVGNRVLVAVVAALGVGSASAAEYRGIVSWQDAQQRCSNNNQHLPSVSELRGLLQNGLASRLPEIRQGHNCSGGIAGVWTSEPSGTGHSILAFGRHPGAAPVEQAFADGNRFHAVCLPGRAPGQGHGHPGHGPGNGPGHGPGNGPGNGPGHHHGNNIQSRAFRCNVVNPIYSSLQNDLRVVTIRNHGTPTTETLFRFNFASDCQAVANRLAQRCGTGGQCRVAFCEARNATYTSLDSNLHLVQSGHGGTMSVNQIETFRFRSECNNALTSYP